MGILEDQLREAIVRAAQANAVEIANQVTYIVEQARLGLSEPSMMIWDATKAPKVFEAVLSTYPQASFIAIIPADLVTMPVFLEGASVAATMTDGKRVLIG